MGRQEKEQEAQSQQSLHQDDDLTKHPF